MLLNFCEYSIFVTNYVLLLISLTVVFQATHMADFSHIQSIQTILSQPQTNTCDAVSGSNFSAANASKASLQLRVAGSSELLTITCPSLDVAESMADLIDGYCRLVNRAPTSIWHRKGMQKIFQTLWKSNTWINFIPYF